MKAIARDVKGIAPVVEYLLAFTVFVLVLSLYYTALGTLFPGYNTESTHLEEKCFAISESLMGNTGWLMGDNLPEGGTEHWETYSYNDLNHVRHLELTSIGLCVDNSSYGQLDYEKVMALETKLAFSTASEIFSLKRNLAINITVESTENDIIRSHFGAEVTVTSRNLVTVERFCIIKNNYNNIPAKLTVKLFYGGTITEN